ncbi:IS21-like element helper ATPase IstB [Dyadobacter frigoris]|uniref:ATP-binding protein n=2 Tax=Dyadobacter frigoris TaxID=2576211 RepID=A0A4V6BLM2_9BACT|nr:IS21-like element helper ATPase IstB [Dyadobacter frigoris]TKT90943.1 ATP-binding protein [Dyadobacter frigoris]
MNTQITVEQLNALKLTGMAKRYQAALALPSHQQEDAHSLIALLCQSELEYRNHYRTERLLKNSKLRYNALLEEVICTPERGLSREMLLRLSDGMFIEKAENILICGQTGTGKSFLACAIGRSCCLLGYKTLYFSMNKFLENLSQAKLDGSYLKWIRNIAGHQVLILDDFGLKPLSPDARLAMLDILEDRYGKSATIVTSQLPVDKWHEFINEPSVADAVLDRLTASANKIDLVGSSLRRRK